jgi:hypothetical protein
MRTTLLLWLLNDYSSSEWWLVYLTGGLVMVTLGLAIYTAKLWGATKTLSQDARATAERQAGEVRESLAISTRMVETMERNAERQLRAYLTVRTGKIFVDERKEGQWWLEWSPQITNVGRTPAYDVDVLGRAEILPIPLQPDVDLDEKLRDKQLPDHPSRSTIGTGQDIWGAYHLNRYLTASELQDLRAWIPQTAFYVYGTVTYWDIFRKEHRTNFCQLAMWTPGRDSTPVGCYTEGHNEAD